MRVCTIFTGGTIGSRVSLEGVISPHSSMAYRLLECYTRQYGTDIDFCIEEPFQILSENLSSENLLHLINTLLNVLNKVKPDGIIITHGTDTLQYTAAVLGYIFAEADVPIVIVSSNYVLDDSRANGLINFKSALDFIKGDYGKGVFVSYQNTGDMPTIHCGTRLQPPEAFSDSVYSVSQSWFGKFDNGKFITNKQFYRNTEQYKLFSSAEEIKLIKCTNQILRIIPYPGMGYPELTENIKVVLHESYHSGTIAISQQLEEFAARAQKLNIPIYLTGLSMNEAKYETVEKYRSFGILPLEESSVISQYCKLWLALSNNLDIIKVMNRSAALDWIKKC